jgi:CubicO group peptidase (beta-lactamase class C family)
MTLQWTVALMCAAALTAGGGGGDELPPPNAGPNNPGNGAYLSVAPDNTGDGWAVGPAAAEGFDAAALETTLGRIRDGRWPGVDAMLVVRNHRLVAEGYFNGFGRDTQHDLRSVGKSFTSAAAGIAIDQGLLGLDDPVAQHVANFDRAANMDDNKRAITIRNLLDMRSGLDCNDDNPNSPGNEERMYLSANWIQFVIDTRMAVAPGTTPSYCTGGVILLGHIIATRSGQSLDAYTQARLFDPLGITQSTWRRAPDGSATGGGGLRLRPRDVAKFGDLYANGGRWGATQVIPEAWVSESLRSTVTLDGAGYGFLWWKRTLGVRGLVREVPAAQGNGGNFIFVLPTERLVVVFTGSNYNSPLFGQPLEIMQQVLDALR